MLTASQIPSPLLDRSHAKPIVIVPVKAPGRFGALTLALRLASLGRRLLAGRIFGRSTPTEQALLVRNFFEEMGGLWIKAGQLLSLRTDLFSREMVDELSNLTFQAQGFPAEVARQVVETALKQPIETVFAEWDALPFAAASVSQVHRARLRKNGELVAVKVQRPGIDVLFARDLKLIGALAWLMDMNPSIRYFRMTSMVRELKQMMSEEVDYRYEAANLRRMRKHLARHNVVAPRVYRRASSQHVLVMEFIDGVLMADYLAVKRSDPVRLKAWESANNVDPYKVASRLMRSFYRQLFEDNLFHGDLHPGNIMLLRDSGVALIDLGTVGNLEERFVRGFRNTYRGFSDGDYAKGVDYHLGMLDSVPVIDIADYRAGMVERLREWEARSHLDGLTAYERSFTGGASMALSEVMLKYRTANNWQMLRLVRSLNTMDANTDALLGNADPKRIWRKYFEQSQRRAVKHLRKNGPQLAVRGLSEFADNASMLSDMVRRQGIVFRGVQSKASYVMGIVVNVVRIGVLMTGLFFLYKFLHQHHSSLVAPISAPTNWWTQLAERVPSTSYWIGAMILVLFFLLFLAVGRLHRRLAAATIRLPGGQLDKA